MVGEDRITQVVDIDAARIERDGDNHTSPQLCPIAMFLKGAGWTEVSVHYDVVKARRLGVMYSAEVPAEADAWQRDASSRVRAARDAGDFSPGPKHGLTPITFTLEFARW